MLERDAVIDAESVIQAGSQPTARFAHSDDLDHRMFAAVVS